MTSIITNSSAMSALSTLRSISADMETTQGRISSGYKVETASDNAAYWSIATTMRSDNKSLGAVEDALGLGAAKTDVASTALESSISVVDEIKAKLVAASEPGVDKSKIQKEITELQNQLVSVAKSASFSGENWTYHDENNAVGTKEIVGSFNRDADGNVSLTTLEFNTQKSSLISKTAGDYTDQQIDAADAATNDVSWLSAKMGYNAIADDGTATPTALDYSVLTLDISGMATTDEVSAAISGVDFVLQKMTDAASDLGALNSRVTLQKDFVADLSDSIEKGVGRLVDADMNEESTRLKALQTQQQLGIQALSIANSDSQNIISLFR
ncbi:flagellin N-terminal helical domain-containing protein [Endobacterium cereale]|jgi:flagellin|uniref:flagellin N-terminal helical domain-containing protein n=1 Tax=Endobacterium cereale TaxID=2663029 RepID=UPI002B4964CE|nr:flagellin [Endobacterium cereale]MEB2848234.1 flagellin [Endobacterium cereale]